MCPRTVNYKKCQEVSPGEVTNERLRPETFTKLLIKPDCRGLFGRHTKPFHLVQRYRTKSSHNGEQQVYKINSFAVGFGYKKVIRGP